MKDARPVPWVLETTMPSQATLTQEGIMLRREATCIVAVREEAYPMPQSS